MRGIGVEMLAQLFGATEFLVAYLDLGADVPESAGQLIMVGVAPRKAVIVDENLQFALAECRVVEVRQAIHRGSGGMHGRLIDEMHIAEEFGVAGHRQRQRLHAPKKRHARRPVLLDHVDHGSRKHLDRFVVRLDHIPTLQLDDGGLHSHSTTLQTCVSLDWQASRNRLPWELVNAIIWEMCKNLLNSPSSIWRRPWPEPMPRGVAQQCAIKHRCLS